MTIGGRRSAVRGLVLLLTLAVTGLVERRMGRSPICPCGEVKLWTGDAYGPENSQMLADWYSLSHILHGMLLYAALWWCAGSKPVGSRFVVAVVVEAAWEIAENSPIVIARYRSATAALGYTGDSILNSMGDVAFMALGFGIARLLPVGAAIAFGVALELIALVAIRDGLTLNVLMLVHPVDAVRAWQSR